MGGMTFIVRQELYNFLSVCDLVFFDFCICLSDINECESQPCVNGGECIDEVDHYNCSCPSGYEGVNCQTGKSRPLENRERRSEEKENSCRLNCTVGSKPYPIEDLLDSHIILQFLFLGSGGTPGFLYSQREVCMRELTDVDQGQYSPIQTRPSSVNTMLAKWLNTKTFESIFAV